MTSSLPRSGGPLGRRVTVFLGVTRSPIARAIAAPTSCGSPALRSSRVRGPCTGRLKYGAVDLDLDHHDAVTPSLPPSSLPGITAGTGRRRAWAGDGALSFSSAPEHRGQHPIESISICSGRTPFGCQPSTQPSVTLGGAGVAARLSGIGMGAVLIFTREALDAPRADAYPVVGKVAGSWAKPCPIIPREGKHRKHRKHPLIQQRFSRFQYRPHWKRHRKHVSPQPPPCFRCGCRFSAAQRGHEQHFRPSNWALFPLFPLFPTCRPAGGDSASRHRSDRRGGILSGSQSPPRNVTRLIPYCRSRNASPRASSGRSRSPLPCLRLLQGASSIAARSAEDNRNPQRFLARGRR